MDSTTASEPLDLELAAELPPRRIHSPIPWSRFYLRGHETGSRLLLAILATADTFTSVLMGIPGSAGSQTTVLDGFPLARRGEARRALTAAFAASLIGGAFGAIALTGFVQIARPLVLSFAVRFEIVIQ